MGWAVANPATRLDENRTGFAFAYLEPATAKTVPTVTVTVTDGDSAVEGAKVTLGGAILYTDASGKAAFPVAEGDYTVKASKSGYVTANTTVKATGTAASVELVLIEK